MAKYRSKRFDDVLGQTVVPQADRYLGNDVLGMEETPARPMGYETGADPAVRMPGRARTFWNEKTMATRSTTNGEPRAEDFLSGPSMDIGGMLHVEVFAHGHHGPMDGGPHHEHGADGPHHGHMEEGPHRNHKDGGPHHKHPHGPEEGED